MQLILLLGCSSAPNPPDLTGDLLWVSEESGSPKAVRGSVSGGGVRPASELEGAVFPAQPDPRGELALFVQSTEEPHLEQLFVAPLSGGQARALGAPSSMVRKPAWSPDGSFIVYESDVESFRDLYRVERDGQGPARLTQEEFGSFEPDVGPDGQVVFVSSRDGGAELYRMGPRGSNPVRLTNRPSDDMRPRWKPDGSQITWLAREGMGVAVYRMDPDGSNPGAFRKETLGRAVALDQLWSPDGTRLAVTVQTGPTEIGIDLLDASGAVVARVDGPGSDEHPAWSPDSRWLVFDSVRDGQAEPDLYRVDRDGGRLVRITMSPGADWLPRWVR